MYFSDTGSVDIHKILSINVENVYHVHGKTFVELNVKNKTSCPVVFGDNFGSIEKTNNIQTVKGFALIDSQHNWYFSQFPNRNIVYTIDAGCDSKLYIIINNDLRDVKLNNFSYVFSYLEYFGNICLEKLFEIRGNI